jgi:ketosteroid isomerase-like protein
MKRILFAAALLVAAAQFAATQAQDKPAQDKPAQPAGEKVSMASAEQAVTTRVQEFLAAVRKGEEAGLAPFYADDYALTTADGSVQTKAQRLEWVKANAARLRALDYGDLKVRVYGDTAVVTGHATGSAEGTPPINSRFIQVWVRQGDTWRTVAGQITDIAPAQPAEQKKP